MINRRTPRHVGADCSTKRNDPWKDSQIRWRGWGDSLKTNDAFTSEYDLQYSSDFVHIHVILSVCTQDYLIYENQYPSQESALSTSECQIGGRSQAIKLFWYWFILSLLQNTRLSSSFRFVLFQEEIRRSSSFTASYFTIRTPKIKILPLEMFHLIKKTYEQALFINLASLLEQSQDQAFLSNWFHLLKQSPSECLSTSAVVWRVKETNLLSSALSKWGNQNIKLSLSAPSTWRNQNIKLQSSARTFWSDQISGSPHQRDPY